MFENSDPWAEIDALIERRAREALAEIRDMAERARDAININIGYSKAFINRSRGQRLRFARQRLLRGDTT